MTTPLREIRCVVQVSWPEDREAVGALCERVHCDLLVFVGTFEVVEQGATQPPLGWPTPCAARKVPFVNLEDYFPRARPVCAVPWAAGALYPNVEDEWVCFFRAKTPFIAENFEHFLDVNGLHADVPLAIGPLTPDGALRDTSPVCLSRQALQRLAPTLASRCADEDNEDLAKLERTLHDTGIETTAHVLHSSGAAWLPPVGWEQPLRPWSPGDYWRALSPVVLARALCRRDHGHGWIAPYAFAFKDAANASDLVAAYDSLNRGEVRRYQKLQFIRRKR
jgi:hypothetical protein